MRDSESKISDLKALDRICDQYEYAWQGGIPPSFAEWLENVPESIREIAFAELLKIDVACRKERGEQPRSEDYSTPSETQLGLLRELCDAETQRSDASLEDTNGHVESGSNQDIPELPDYDILGELGRGGMGVVYRAHQKSLDRIVAIKLIRAGEWASKETVERFVSEAKAAAKLQHPGIVNIFEVGQFEGLWYFSMEYVEGRTMDAVLRDESLCQQDICRYLAGVADAIDFAHQQGVIHRDIKPSNLIIDRFDRVKVMDFGLAKVTDNATALTRSGQIFGTPAYMSPEQARGDHAAIDHRSDIYSIGAVLYRALAGRPVFQSDSIAETVAMVVRDDPQSLHEHNADVDIDLDSTCLRCLHKIPDHRFRSAAELATALRKHIDPKAAGRGRRSPVDMRVFLQGLAATVGVLVVAGIIITVQLNEKKVVVKSDDDVEISTSEDDVQIRTNGKVIGIKETTGAEPGLEAKSSLKARSSNTHLAPETTDGLGQLSRDSIDPYELAFAGNGDPDQAPEGLVAVLGQSLGRGSARDIDVSPDGSTVASIGTDGRSRIWEVATMRQTNIWGTSDEFVRFTAKNTVVTVGGGERISVWDVSRYPKLIAATNALDQKAKSTDVVSMSFSNETRKLAVLAHSKDNPPRVRVWNCDERGVPVVEESITFDVDANTTRIAINSAGTLLATNALKGKLQLWKLDDQPSKAVKCSVEGAQIHEFAFSPDGKWLAAACDEMGCVVWDLSEPTPVLKYTLLMPSGTGGGYRRVAFSADSSQIASGRWHALVDIWRITDEKVSRGTRLKKDLTGAQGVNRIAFTPIGTSLITANADKQIRVADLTKRPPRALLPRKGHSTWNARVDHVSLSGKSAITHAGYELIIWEMEDGRFDQVNSTSRHLPGMGDTVAVNREGSLMAVAQATSIHVMRIAGGDTFLQQVLTADADVRSVAMLNDGTQLASKDQNGEVRLWDIESGDHTVVDRFEVNNYGGHAVAFSSNGALLAASGTPAEGKRRVRIWDISQVPPQRMKHLEPLDSSEVTSLQFSPDGRLLLRSGPAVLGITDLSGNEAKSVFEHKLSSRDRQRGAFSADGSMVAMSVTREKKNRLELRDTKTFQLIREWTDIVQAQPRFAPDNRHLFTGNLDGSVYVLRLDGKGLEKN